MMSGVPQMARRLSVASVDLMASANYAKELAQRRKQADASPELMGALVVATIVSYARPFLSSYSGGQAAKSVDPVQLGVFEKFPELRPLHDRLIHLRNNAVAHSAWEYHSSHDTDEGRAVHTWNLERELEDVDAVLKLIGMMGAFFLNSQYVLDGKAPPFVQDPKGKS